MPSICFLEIGKIDWASIDTLITEFAAFGVAAKNAGHRDLIAKIDSDVLFFDSAKLIEMCRNEADFIGDGHYSNYMYAQGGLYIMRRKIAILLSEFTKKQIKDIVSLCNSIAEDQVVSLIVRKTTKKIWLTRIMLFPDEFTKKLNFNNKWLKKEFCALHFVHKKTDMKKYSDKIVNI